MKKRTGIILLLILCFSLSTTSFTFASSKTLVKEFNVTTNSDNIKNSKLDNSYMELKEDNVKYKLKQVEFTNIKPKKITKTYSNLAKQEVPKEIVDKNKKLKLEDVKYTEKNITKRDSYNNQIKKPEIPQSKTIELENGKTVVAELKNVDHSISSTYNVPFSMPAKFYGSKDVLVYVMNGKEIPSTNAPEFTNYRNEVLAYLNLDKSTYRVDQGRWQGDYYTENGQVVRNAVFSGMQKSNTYIATYEGKVYEAKAIYVDDDDVTATAIATYEKAGLSTVEKVLIVAAAVVILALLISIILFILRRRNKEEEQ